MKLSQYGYEFAPEMLAKHPTENRDDSRLMVINRAKGTVEHRIFKDIIEYFDEKDLFVFNDTKVFPARLYGNKEKTGAEIEIFLLRELNRELRLWDVLVDPARKIRIGNKLYFGDDDLLVAEVIDNTTSRGRTLRFLFDGSYEEFKQALFSLGETPLPKWVRDKVEPEDAERYQTIFARHEGAVAAPTAGMHFSKHLMKRMEIKGIDKTFVTLHVGLGNFRTVDVEDLSKHKMDSEQFFVEEAAAEAVNAAKRQERKVVAIGTTVMRTIETAVSTNGMIKPMEGWTNKFIFAPYEFTVADAMVTNLHLPYSTQLLMVAAFGGYETVMPPSTVATAEGYRYVSSRNESFNPKTQGRFETIFHEPVLGVDYAGHVVLVKCYSGMANAACEVFDALQWKNVVGTLSGDDTFLIVARSERDAKTICSELTRHIG